MPKEITTTNSSSALSSDSSLSSAPESEDFALEDTITSVSIDSTGAVASLTETAVQIARSKKRQRTEQPTEAKVPAKRAKRGIVTGLSYKEEEVGEEKTVVPTKILETPTQKRRRSAKLLIVGIETAAVKSEIVEDVDVASKGAVKRVQRGAKVEVEAVTEEDLGSNSPKRSGKRAKVSIKPKEQEEEQAASPSTPKRSKKGKKTVTEEQDVAAEEVVDGNPTKAKRKRKTKEEKEAEAMPLAARTTGLKMYLGAHVSSAKGPSSLESGSPTACIYISSSRLRQSIATGVHNAVTNCVHIG